MSAPLTATMCVTQSTRRSREMWEAAFGPVPEGLQVLHRCHDERCVRLSHLYLGTHQDNMRDRREAGRTARGERHGMARVSDAQADAARRALAAGARGVDVAVMLGVSKAWVSRLQNGTLRTLPRPTPAAEAAVVAERMRASRARRREVSR